VNPIICFIDDSAFEHDLVRNEIAPLADGMTFLQTVTFEEAVDRLNGRAPALFLLDLWGQDPDVPQPEITTLEELQDTAARIPGLPSVFSGLETFPGDRNNEYLKRLFCIVDGWRNLFEGACSRVGQNRKYGLRNLRLAREAYPDAPAVFYTRKSLINDAVAMFRAGCDGLVHKPTGRDDGETRRLTRAYAPELVEELSRVINRPRPLRSADRPC